MMTIQRASPEDIFEWPDGTRCYRSEYERGHYAQMSDDFIVIQVGDARHATAADDMEGEEA